MKRADIVMKRETLDILDDLFRILDDKEEDTKKTWGCTGNKVPKTKWDDELNKRVDVINEETGEVVMVDEYDYIPKKKDEFTELDNAKLDAIKTIKTALEKLI